MFTLRGGVWLAVGWNCLACAAGAGGTFSTGGAKGSTGVSASTTGSGMGASGSATGTSAGASSGTTAIGASSSSGGVGSTGPATTGSTGTGSASGALSSSGAGQTGSTSTGTGTAAGGTSGGAACAGGQIRCGGSCVDPTIDPGNCGGCGTRCAVGQICGTGFDAGFGQAPPDWLLFGVPYVSANDGALVLTDLTTTSQGSSAVFATPIAANRFSVALTFRIAVAQPPNFYGDGLGLLLLSTGTPSFLGNFGGGLGMSGLQGVGVEFDTYNDNGCGDTNANHVGIDSLTSCPSGLPQSLVSSADLSTPAAFLGQPDASITLIDGNPHTALVTVVDGEMSVALDTFPVFDTVDLTDAGFVPGAPLYFGVAAATGSGVQLQELSRFAVSFPGGACY